MFQKSVMLLSVEGRSFEDNTHTSLIYKNQNIENQRSHAVCNRLSYEMKYIQNLASEIHEK